MKLLRQRSPDYSDYDELFQNVIESWLKARNKMKVYLYIKSKVAFPVSESGARVAVAVAWLVRGTADCTDQSLCTLDHSRQSQERRSYH